MTKLEKELSPEQLAQFNATLAATPGLTLQRIVDLAEAQGVTVSVMGAKRYRDGKFADFLSRMEEAKETADAVTAVAEGGQSLADASAAAMSQMVFRRLLADPSADARDVDRFSKIIARLRIGDQRNILLEQRERELAAKLDALQRKAADDRQAAQAVAQDKALTPAQREARYKEIFGLQ